MKLLPSISKRPDPTRETCACEALAKHEGAILDSIDLTRLNGELVEIMEAGARRSDFVLARGRPVRAGAERG